MTRLPRSRKGKTPIDVTVTRQPAGPRVRLSVGRLNGLGQVNSDLDVKEVNDLVTMLLYHLAVITGKVEDKPESQSIGDDIDF